MRRIPAIRIFRLAKRHGITALDVPCAQNYGHGFVLPPRTSKEDRLAFHAAFRRAFNEELRLAAWCWQCGRPLVADAPCLPEKSKHLPADLDRQFRAVAFRCAWCFQTYCHKCGLEHFEKDQKKKPGAARRPKCRAKYPPHQRAGAKGATKREPPPVKARKSKRA